MMDIGPVLHADDVVAGMMSALYTRAEPRDFLDVDASITTGRYSPEQLCDLAEQADAGFDRHVLAEVFALLPRYPDRRFATYGRTAQDIHALRTRFAAWRARRATGVLRSAGEESDMRGSSGLRKACEAPHAHVVSAYDHRQRLA